jgi:O-Antigen ligase
MFFLKCFDVNRLIFGVTLFGYGVFAFALTNPETTQLVTVPYRALVLISNVIMIFHRLVISKGSASKNKNMNRRINSAKEITFLAVIFMFLYSCRVIHSVYISDGILLLSNKFQYILYWFFVCLIPAINFLFMDKILAYKYMYVTWIILLLISVPSLFLDINTSSQFSEVGRLATAAINPIALGHYATSLFLLSFYIIMNKKQYESLPAIASNVLLLAGASLVGVFVTLSAASRSPLLALSSCLIILLLTSLFKDKVNGRIIFILLFTIVCGVLVIVFSSSLNNQFFERIFSTADELDIADERSRGYLYDTTIKLFLDHSIFGFDLELPNGQGYTHNLFLESFLALGFGGGILFGIITLYTVNAAIKLLISKSSQWGWVGILFIQYTIAGTSSGALYGSSSFWYLMFAVLGAYNSLSVNKDLKLNAPIQI